MNNIIMSLTGKNLSESRQLKVLPSQLLVAEVSEAGKCPMCSRKLTFTPDLETPLSF
ncbi:hypothetical protein [Microcoleus sp. N9_A1]|uniref:hypothetical protein n=1 Tax=Microcoleus sp. N9_A1 TaxID=3055380 RepID=UPI002FD132E8